MTFIAAVTALARRFLTERSYDLIVAPALADLQYDIATTGTRRIGSHAAVVSALIGAGWDDVVRGGHVGTFAGLALIPLCYYTFWFLVWVPQGVQHLGGTFMAVITILLIVLSLAPVIVCYWPPAPPSDASPEQS